MLDGKPTNGFTSISSCSMAALKSFFAAAVHFRTVFSALPFDTLTRQAFASPFDIARSGLLSPK
ncbi:MAG: hypothetical protein AAGA92_05470 [Planctomycetota bacterium]